MNTIIEQALQLPKEEKLELYFALQEDLDNEQLEGDELTKEQWEEIQQRYKNIEDDASQFMSGDEFLLKLNVLRNELRSKRS